MLNNTPIGELCRLNINFSSRARRLTVKCLKSKALSPFLFTCKILVKVLVFISRQEMFNLPRSVYRMLTHYIFFPSLFEETFSLMFIAKNLTKPCRCNYRFRALDIRSRRSVPYSCRMFDVYLVMIGHVLIHTDANCHRRVFGPRGPKTRGGTLGLPA